MLVREYAVVKSKALDDTDTVALLGLEATLSDDVTLSVVKMSEVVPPLEVWTGAALLV